MLKLTNIEVMYSGVILVLKGVSLEVGDSQVVALVGSNGAGKSTTVKAISGLLNVEDGAITGGSIEFNGKRINEMDPTARVKSGLISVMEGRKCLEHLTVESCLRLAAHLRSDKNEIKDDLDMIYQVFPLLKRVRNQVAGYLSGGERQMLVIAQSMMAAPQCMILDEPSQGLAPKIVHQIFDVLKSLNEMKRVSMLMVEQNVRMALKYADHGYVMENGRIVLDGSARDLTENEDLREFYLGMSVTGKRKSYRDVKHYKRRKRWAG